MKFALVGLAGLALLAGAPNPPQKEAQFEIATQGGQILVQAKAFHAQAQRVKYDWKSGALILEGEKANPATLWKQRGKTEEKIQGEKIFYWVKTGDMKITP